MDEVKKEVETKTEVASTQQQEVKKEETGASAVQIDYAAELAKKDAELAKLAIERDNYKNGLLAAKGKLPEQQVVENQPDIEALIDQKVSEKLYSEKEKQIQAEKNALLEDALKKVSELSTALANKQGITTSAGGTSSDNSQPQNQFFSPDQIRDLKARGWDDAKIAKAAEKMKR